MLIQAVSTKNFCNVNWIREMNQNKVFKWIRVLNSQSVKNIINQEWIREKDIEFITRIHYLFLEFNLNSLFFRNNNEFAMKSLWNHYEITIILLVHFANSLYIKKVFCRNGLNHLSANSRWSYSRDPYECHFVSAKSI